MKDPLNYIMHIPKTAGLSIQGLVRRRHKKPGALELVYSQRDVENGFDDRPDLETVMGHFRFGFHRFSEKPFRYFTFLRDPVQHVISHYHYSFDYPEKFQDLPEDIANLDDFARCPYGNNLQTRFISGIDNIKGRELEAIQIAKNNLDKYFEVVGLTEHFDLSLMLLGKALGWKIIYYVRENTGNSRREKSVVTEKQIAELKVILQYDMELYEYGKKIFEKQVAENPELIRQLSAFKVKNRIFQQLNPAYIQIKKLLGKTSLS